jgi:hypothetical protein
MEVVDPSIVTEFAYNDEAIALAAKYAERKAHVEEKAKMFFETLRVRNDIKFFCFLDGTSSMESCLNASKKAVERMARKLCKEYAESTVKCGAVIFRDPLEGSDEANRHEVLPFGDVASFSKFMKGVKATGGGDEAEDVAGGLKLALQILKEVSESDTVFWAHVSDSHPHGLSPEEGSDHHNNQTQRDELSDVLGQLVARSKQFASFEYHYFLPKRNVRLHTRKAVDEYKRMLASKLDDPADIGNFFKLCLCTDLEDAFMNSVYNSVSLSIVAAGEDKKIDMFAPCTRITTQKDIFSKYGMMLDIPPEDNAVFRMSPSAMTDAIAFSGAKLRKADFPRSPCFQRHLAEYAKEALTLDLFQSGFAGFSQHLYAQPYGKRTFEVSSLTSTDILLFVNPKPFGRGRERAVCHGMVCENVDEVTTKEIVSMGTGDIEGIVERIVNKESITLTPAVFKFSIIGDAALLDVDAKIAIHTVALWCSSSFNRTLPFVKSSLPIVEVLSPFVIKFDDQVRCKQPGKTSFVKTKNLDGIKVLGEFSLEETGSPFEKRINNDGARSHKMDGEDNSDYPTKEVVLDLFNLATSAWTGLNLVFTDIQGVFHNQHFVLTDLAIASKNKMAFDETVNWGAPAVKKVVLEARLNAKTHAPEIYAKFLSVFRFSDDIFLRV